MVSSTLQEGLTNDLNSVLHSSSICCWLRKDFCTGSIESALPTQFNLCQKAHVASVSLATPNDADDAHADDDGDDDDDDAPRMLPFCCSSQAICLNGAPLVVLLASLWFARQHVFRVTLVSQQIVDSVRRKQIGCNFCLVVLRNLRDGITHKSHVEHAKAPLLNCT